MYVMCYSWRQWHTDRRVEAKTGFIDGDIIEQYLDLPATKQEQVHHQHIVSSL